MQTDLPMGAVTQNLLKKTVNKTACHELALIETLI